MARTVQIDTDQSASPERLLALDVFRGATILGMILVGNAGDWSRVYRPLGHPPWHGWTACDLVFPFFLFIVGTAMAYSLRKYRSGTQIDGRVYWRIGRRVLLLFLLGLLLNCSGPWIGQLLDSGKEFSFAALRIPGVLQRIAIVYGIASLVVLHSGLRTQMVLSITLLLGYWALLAWLPNPAQYESNLSAEGSVGRIVDLAVLGESHIYSGARVNKEPDPEGILSTLPAIVTTLLGYWTGLFIQRRPANRRTVGWLVGIGVVLFAIGQLWGFVLPINKKIWTSSYVLLAGGLAMLGLAFCLWLFDVANWRRLAKPFQIVGINAIFIYVASGIVGRILSHAQVNGCTIKTWLYQNLFAEPWGSGEFASMLYALATVAIWWIVLWLMSLRGWSIRI